MIVLARAKQRTYGVIALALGLQRQDKLHQIIVHVRQRIKDVRHMGWGPPFSNHPKSVSGPIIKLQCQLKWMSRIKDPIYLSLAEKKDK